MRRFDHVDLRVRNLEEARPFYEALLPALGFERPAGIPGWIQFESSRVDQPSEFFGLTESPGHVANESRIAFWAATNDEVDRVARLAMDAGARHCEGPSHESPTYYAFFFEDPSGNRLEICHRK